MINRLLFDTDVLIDYLRGYEKSRSFLLENNKNTLLLSSITIAELFAGVRNDDEINCINSLLVIFNIIDVNALIAKKGGILKQKYSKKNGMGLADALIAATTIEINATLVTLNVKHYPDEINIIVPYNKI